MEYFKHCTILQVCIPSFEFLHCTHFQALYFCTCDAFGIWGLSACFSEMISSKWNYASHKLNTCKDSVCDKAAARAASLSIFFSERMTVLHRSCSLPYISTSPRCECVCVCVHVCVYEWEAVCCRLSKLSNTHTQQTLSRWLKIKHQQVRSSNSVTPPLCNMLIYWSHGSNVSWL